MRFSLTMPAPQERLFGERVVVKEIEIFGICWHPTVGEDLGGAERPALREKTMAQSTPHYAGRFVVKSLSRVARPARGAVRTRCVLVQYGEGPRGEPAGGRLVAAALMNNAG